MVTFRALSTRRARPKTSCVASGRFSVNSPVAFCNKCSGPLHCEACHPSQRLQQAEAKCVELHGAHGRLQERLKALHEKNDANAAALNAATDSLTRAVNQRDAALRALRNIVSSRSGEFREIARDTLDMIEQEMAH